MARKVVRAPSLSELEEILGSKQRVLFFQTWLKHGRNATRAYMELHPGVDERSASTLGSKMLGNIDMKVVAQAYGITHDLYFKNLAAAANATKWNDFTGEREADHKTREPYHKKMGKILGVETDTPNQTNIQVNVAPLLGGESVGASNNSDKKTTETNQET